MVELKHKTPVQFDVQGSPRFQLRRFFIGSTSILLMSCKAFTAAGQKKKKQQRNIFLLPIEEAKVAARGREQANKEKTEVKGLPSAGSVIESSACVCAPTRQGDQHNQISRKAIDTETTGSSLWTAISGSTVRPLLKLEVLQGIPASRSRLSCHKKY